MTKSKGITKKFRLWANILLRSWRAISLRTNAFNFGGSASFLTRDLKCWPPTGLRIEMLARSWSRWGFPCRRMRYRSSSSIWVHIISQSGLTDSCKWGMTGCRGDSTWCLIRTSLGPRFSNCSCDLYSCQSAPSMCRSRTGRWILSQFHFQLHSYAQATMSSTNDGERCVVEWKFIRPLAIISPIIFVKDERSFGHHTYNSDACQLTSRPSWMREFPITQSYPSRNLDLNHPQISEGVTIHVFVIYQLSLNLPVDFIACPHLLLQMYAPVPTCHGPFLNMSWSRP